MPSINDYQYSEAQESAKGTIGKDGSAQRIFNDIAWSDLGGFLVALMPGWTVTGNVYTYSPGDRHPNLPTYYCESAQWEGYGQSSFDNTAKASAWSYAKVTATYKPPAFDPSKGTPEDIIEEELDFSVEELSIPSGSLKKSGSSSADDVIQSTTRKVIPVCDYTLTIHDLPQLPGGNASLIMGKLGKVNSVAIKGAAPKTGLYAGCRTSRTITSVGTRGWKIAHKFMVRPPGLEWTKVFSPKDGAWIEAETVNGGDPLYESDDLNQLLPR